MVKELYMEIGTTSNLYVATVLTRMTIPIDKDGSIALGLCYQVNKKR